METWFRLPTVVRLITHSAYWATASSFGLLAIRNLIHWRQTRAHMALHIVRASGAKSAFEAMCSGGSCKVIEIAPPFFTAGLCTSAHRPCH
jgi:hypothetical protein